MNPLSAAEFNALPPHVREYIYHLESDADPAGDKGRLLQMEWYVAGATNEIEYLTGRVADLEAKLERIRLVPDYDHAMDEVEKIIDEVMTAPGANTSSEASVSHSAEASRPSELSPNRCPKCGEKLGEDGHHKPYPISPFV